ncbi:unnamed protein product [Rotaria socialis]
MNKAKAKLTEDEYQLLKLGTRFIYNDPKAPSRRRTTELAVLKQKIETRFFEKKVSPGKAVGQFIAELDSLLKNLHDTPARKISRQHEQQYEQQREIISYDILLHTIHLNQCQTTKCSIGTEKKKNYPRLVKRLKQKLRSASIVLQKRDKSKVFHLERTNKYLLNLRLKHWITQRQYEQLSVKPNEVKLAHLYYLPKVHKLGTPLRPIVSGLKHPTIKISKLLDGLLRPFFDGMVSNTTVTSGTEVIKLLQEWSKRNIRQETLLCTMDVMDLYTMIPQTEGFLSIKKMLDYLNIKQIDGLKMETIMRLCRFVIQNNYFSYNGKYYHQVRGCAMGSPLTLTIANCYMFFFERDIVKQISNSNGFYIRYIDGIFITINWPTQHLSKQSIDGINSTLTLN